MESIQQQIRKHYDQLGYAERKIANYVLEHTEDIIELSVSQLSAACGCGDATVVRFARRLGYSGYQSMKIGIAGRMGSVSTISEEITREDSCFEIYKKCSLEIISSLEETQSVLDPDSLEKAAKMIMKAKRIVIFGLGNSASIAIDAAHKLLRLGKDAQACNDNHLQAIIASHLDHDSVAIGISHSGSSKDIIEALELSKIGGAGTVSITNYAKSPIVKVSDVALFTKSRETKRSLLALSSRMAQLAIIDAIYNYIIINSEKSIISAIYNTEASLQQLCASCIRGKTPL